jgi:hypothetical protein
MRTPADLADGFLRALGTLDFDLMRTLLADDIWMRAMLVREVVEAHDADTVVGYLAQWYGTALEVQLADSDEHPMMGRHFVRYRMRLRPAWAHDVWHVVEQAGYLTISDGRIRRLDLTCTGFFPDGSSVSSVTHRQIA